MKRMLTRIVLGLVCAGVASASQASGTPIRVFIFAGQSNMTGEFGMDELDFMGYDLALPQADIPGDYWLAGATRPGGWGPLEPHDEVTFTSYSSELSFMRLVKDGDPGTQYASLKLSRGGANLAYGLDAIQRLTDMGYEPEVVGLIWIHGDGDLFVQSHAESYAANLDELVTAFRADFAAPNMMAIVSQLHIDQRNGNSLVPIERQQKIDFVNADSNAVLINNDDLAFRDFFVHLDGTSRLILGQRMADAYLASLPPPCDADLTGDGVLDNGDLIAFVGLFLAMDPSIDLNADGFIDNGDIIAFVTLFLAGC
jgi:hypothetical protein